MSSKIDLPQVIAKLLKQESELQDPLLMFEPSREAAEKNFQIMEQNNLNLESVLNNLEKSITTYGSKFKSTTLLQELLQKHPRWHMMKNQLENGVSFPTRELTKEIHNLDVMQAVKQGNHKSAENHADALEEAIKKEIEHEWMILLKAADALKIPNVEIAPLGVAEHLGINAEGEFVPKRRVTHDLSFPGAFSKESINSCIQS